MTDPTPAHPPSDTPDGPEATHATAAHRQLDLAIREVIDPEAALREIRRHLVMIYGERAIADTRRGAG